ncbi:DNA-directed RNA polymerase subunit omega [Psittacicella gerlachiana]|uniref:DNA-directed RNA polymerase subunit omega n=1 Tax=Psittacicella gerlachiana TaxID=2028574 RepID=A0A3A1YC61_9GAMM|nr:DNA-directed RNA polymerase subunit omega [Psittacicella gerlachiana]RIY33804.1 DNA-directed RNA polymerase subunit omega [Psittacicella gerlachiana]
MQDNKTVNITQALKKIPNRFELIAVAARRARQIQEYEAAVAKAESNYRNTSTLVLAQARVKGGKNGAKESKIETQLKELRNNPINIFVDNSVTKDKPTVVALREIQEGYVNKEYLDRKDIFDQIQDQTNSFEEVDNLLQATDDTFDEETFKSLKDDFKTFKNEHEEEFDDEITSDFFDVVSPFDEDFEDDDDK